MREEVKKDETKRVKGQELHNVRRTGVTMSRPYSGTTGGKRENNMGGQRTASTIFRGEARYGG